MMTDSQDDLMIASPVPDPKDPPNTKPGRGTGRGRGRGKTATPTGRLKRTAAAVSSVEAPRDTKATVATEEMEDTTHEVPTAEDDKTNETQSLGPPRHEVSEIHEKSWVKIGHHPAKETIKR